MQETLALAVAGDEQAFRELTEPFRRELQVHLYRIVGSVQDAEDLVQETMLAAWRSLDRFEGRSSLRAWMYRIATNRALNALRDGRRRPAPIAPPDMPEPTRMSEPVRFDPYPDALLAALPDHAPGPEARYDTSESLSLAFVAALQHLPPRQRAVLVLRDVLGFRAAEAADMLGSSEHSVNSALKRARATMSTRLPVGRSDAPLPGSPRERAVVARFVDAFEAGDVPRIVALLTDDAWLIMPPLPFEYQGPEAAALFLSTAGFRGCTRRWRLVATRANGQPAFGCYVLDGPSAVGHGVLVLTLEGDRISALTRFADDALMPAFDLPSRLGSIPVPH